MALPLFGKEKQCQTLTVHGEKAQKQRQGFTKDTRDDEKDFPSSFVHDKRSDSCKDDLDQTHEH